MTHFVEETGFTKDGKELAVKLRSVMTELARASDLLEGITDDTMPYFNEVKLKQKHCIPFLLYIVGAGKRTG